jgi:probable HAF family extracellular repeat protein
LPGGSYPHARVKGISADGGTVVGFGIPAAGGIEAFRWTAEAGIVGLGDVPPDENFHSYAYAVSADGSVIVGYGDSYSLGYQTRQAFRWTEEAGVTILPNLLGGSGIWATDVSSDGSVIVGQAHLSGVNPPEEPFRWTEEAGMVSLGSMPGAHQTWAFGVSADGTIVVGAGVTGLDEAFRWTEAEGMVGLGFLPNENSSRARNISADGTTIVGHSGSAGGREAFRWTAPTGMVGLGNELGTSSGIAVSTDGSIIVGDLNGNTTSGAFIWDEVNGMRDLQNVLENDLGLDMSGWDLYVATGISDDGLTIAGTGNNPNGDYEGWVVNMGTINTLSMKVEPNDIGIGTVTPQIGDYQYYMNRIIQLSADKYVLCPNVYRFDHWEGGVIDPFSEATTIVMDTDKNITAVFVPTRECGDECHPNFLLGDHNHDCIVDFADFVLFGSRWLTCTKPECD